MNTASVTCIKLAPIVYTLASTLGVGGTFSIRGVAPLAIVAEEGQATLDGGGVQRVGGGLIKSRPGAQVALASLVLRNGFANVRRMLPLMRVCTAMGCYPLPGQRH